MLERPDGQVFRLRDRADEEGGKPGPAIQDWPLGSERVRDAGSEILLPRAEGPVLPSPDEVPEDMALRVGTRLRSCQQPVHRSSEEEISAETVQVPFEPAVVLAHVSDWHSGLYGNRSQLRNTLNTLRSQNL